MTGLSRETEDVLRRARLTEAMPESRRRRIKVALLARLAAAGGVALTASEAAGAGFWASAVGAGVKGVASLVVVASLGAGGYMAARASRPSVAARPVATLVARDAAPSRHPMPYEKRLAPIEPVAPPTNAVALEAREHEEPVVKAPRVVSRATVAAPARTRSVSRAKDPEPVVTSVEPERAPAVEPPRAADPLPAEHSTLADEMPLLRAADRALRAGKFDVALGWLDQHAARFPDGVLAPERSGERLIALCQLGKADRSAAARFLAGQEGSPLAARVKQACGLSGR